MQFTKSNYLHQPSEIHKLNIRRGSCWMMGRHCLSLMLSLVAPSLPGITLLLLDGMFAMEFADTGHLCFYGPLLITVNNILCLPPHSNVRTVWGLSNRRPLRPSLLIILCAL